MRQQELRAGEQIAVPTTMDPNTWYLDLIGGCTLIEATYDANAEEPENRQVKATIATGVTKVSLLRQDTPDAVLRYFKGAGNKWNTKGSATSFLERYLDVESVMETIGAISKHSSAGDDEDDYVEPVDDAGMEDDDEAGGDGDAKGRSYKAAITSHDSGVDS